MSGREVLAFLLAVMAAGEPLAHRPSLAANGGCNCSDCARTG